MRPDRLLKFGSSGQPVALLPPQQRSSMCARQPSPPRVADLGAVPRARGQRGRIPPRGPCADLQSSVAAPPQRRCLAGAHQGHPRRDPRQLSLAADVEGTAGQGHPGGQGTGSGAYPTAWHLGQGQAPPSQAGRADLPQRQGQPMRQPGLPRCAGRVRYRGLDEPARLRLGQRAPWRGAEAHSSSPIRGTSAWPPFPCPPMRKPIRA